MRSFLILIFLSVLQTAVQAQKKGQDLIDSVNNAPGFSRQDTFRVRGLITIAQTLLYLDPRKAVTPALEGIALSKTLHWRKGEANSLNALGLIVGDTGNNIAARKYFEEAIVINRADSNNYRIITNLNNIGRTYQREGNYPVAIDHFLQGLKLADEIKADDQVSLMSSALMTIYIAQQDFPRAKQYGLMSVEHGEKVHSMGNVAMAYTNLGIVNMYLGDTAASKDCFARGLKILRDMGNLVQAAYNMESRAHLDLANVPVALPELLAVRKLLDSVSPRSATSMMNLGNVAMCYDAIADSKSSPAKKRAYQDTALLYMNRSLSLTRAAHNQDAELQVLHGMAIVEEKAGMPALALQHFKQSTALNDSLFSQTKKNQIAGLQGKHDLELKDKEIAISKLEANNQRLQLAAQKKTQLGLVIGIGLLLAIGALVFRQSRQRKKTNTTLLSLNGQLDEANKVKARFFGILSHDLRGPISNLLSFLHLVKNEPGMLTAEEESSHQQRIGQSAEELLETMEAMLLWSKEQMADFKPDIRIIPVAGLFSYVEKFFGSDQRAQILFSDPQNLSVSGDENYLRVIMQNLTSNALKAINHSPGGLIQWEAASDGNRTLLTITDNGPGLNKDQAKALYQDSPGVNAGTGFGFHLVRDLAKAIRYTISVDSTPGSGTRFTLVA